jgi:hypothetical protein
VDELDERLTVYHDNDGWRRFTLPKLRAMGSRKVAEAVGVSERRARDVLKGSDAAPWTPGGDGAASDVGT